MTIIGSIPCVVPGTGLQVSVKPGRSALCLALFVNKNSAHIGPQKGLTCRMGRDSMFLLCLTSTSALILV
jgi:hypothetical protein